MSYYRDRDRKRDKDRDRDREMDSGRDGGGDGDRNRTGIWTWTGTGTRTDPILLQHTKQFEQFMNPITQLQIEKCQRDSVCALYVCKLNKLIPVVKFVLAKSDIFN